MKPWTLDVENVVNVKGRGRIAVGEVPGADGDRLPKAGDTAVTNTGLVVRVVAVELLKGFIINRKSVGVVMFPNEAAESVQPGSTLTRLT